MYIWDNELEQKREPTPAFHDLSDKDCNRLFYGFVAVLIIISGIVYLFLR